MNTSNQSHHQQNCSALNGLLDWTHHRIRIGTKLLNAKLKATGMTVATLLGDSVLRLRHGTVSEAKSSHPSNGMPHERNKSQ